MSRKEHAITSAETSQPYRHDLDGLRGLAIALVVVFHIWFRRVSGGVDIFLVLSGFFFTGLLLRRNDSTGAVGVVATLRRTLRRLLPAMVTVLVAVAVATVLISPYTRWADVADQTLASLFYYQNWQLALSWSDYLAADPSVSPLQHLWSMAVQGQFYLAAVLFVGVLAWGCRHVGKAGLVRPATLTAALTLGAASFAYAANGHATQQGWNYYDSLARAWELLAGVALAVLAPLLTPARATRIVLAVLGVSGVLACGWLFNGANAFPGPAALFPVATAAALIIAGTGLPAAEQPWPNRLLATRPMVELGALAYPLYLWHWPILIFYLVEFEQRMVDFAEGLLIIALSLALAWMTHRWIEQPLRQAARSESGSAPRSYRWLARAGVALASVLVIAAASVWHVIVNSQPTAPAAALDPVLYPGAEALTAGIAAPPAKMRPTVFEAPSELPPPTLQGCIADWNTRTVVTCTYGDQEAERTLAVVGSSHAEHWLPALDLLATENHFRIVVYLKMGCPLTVEAEPLYKGEANPDCVNWTREVIDRLGTEQPDWVFTTGTRPVDDGGDETPADYLDVWNELTARGLNVIVIRDTPWLRHNGIRYRAVDCLSKGGDRLGCGMRRADALNPVNPAIEAAAGYPNIYPIDLTDAVCEPEICPAVEGNVLIYHDEHHLTATYSRTLAPALGRQLGPILGWW
ncbi:acyltransferase [Nocardia sp. NBC_01503]|uniref:acyltransferase family protein n=1 Tax=Nocardia sp. NBC_01503 TaxID=2975997 RepID=UPI002E7BD4FF|nr:acyltransferase family protein [Nocardia sp. NBC_01503]WTL30997.1 acyltransferase [Nocardia sp. NBC_01503]